jgi:hypothetical protein
LNSALKAGPQLSSVVVTSSLIAVIDPGAEPNHVFTEAEFASTALERATKERDEGVKTPGNVLYAASKTAADRFTWKFREQNKVGLCSISLGFLDHCMICILKKDMNLSWVNTISLGVNILIPAIAIICHLKHKSRGGHRPTHRTTSFRITT